MLFDVYIYSWSVFKTSPIFPRSCRTIQKYIFILLRLKVVDDSLTDKVVKLDQLNMRLISAKICKLRIKNGTHVKITSSICLQQILNGINSNIIASTMTESLGTVQ